MRRFALACPLALLLALPAAAQASYDKARVKEGQEKISTPVAERSQLLTSAAARRDYLETVAEVERPAAAIELAGRLAAQLDRETAGSEKAAPAAAGGLPESYGEVVDLYVSAAQTGTPRQAAYAHNEIATLYLRAGKPEHAVEVFRRLDLDAVPAERRFAYRFNRGRAYEQAGAGERALDDYLAVVADRPAFRPAVEGAWRTLAAAPADDRQAPLQAERLARLLLDEGQHAAVDEVLWPALRRWRSPGLFAVLAERWAADPPADGALPAADERRLRALGEPLADELAEAFDAAPFERAARAAAGGSLDRLWQLANERFPEWRRLGRGPALSALLTRLAADDRRRGDPRPALARTFVAWWIDRDNTQAASECAAVLAAKPDLDPEGDIVAELVDVVVEDKGRAYAAGDWRNALRMHLLLAGIFEERGVWGSSDQLRSAIFQLEHATWAEERIREEDPEYLVSPGLHRRLGEAYAAVGDEDRACIHYGLAAEGLEARERGEEAAKLKERCGG